MIDIGYSDDEDLAPSTPRRAIRLTINIGEEISDEYYLVNLVKPTSYASGLLDYVVPSQPQQVFISDADDVVELATIMGSVIKDSMYDFRDSYFESYYELATLAKSSMVDKLGADRAAELSDLYTVPSDALAKTTASIEALPYNVNYALPETEDQYGLKAVYTERLQGLLEQLNGDAPLTGEEVPLESDGSFTNINTGFYLPSYPRSDINNVPFITISNVGWNLSGTNSNKKSYKLSVVAKVVEDPNVTGAGVADGGAGSASSGFNEPAAKLPEGSFLVQPHWMIDKFGHLVPDVGIVLSKSEITDRDVVLHPVTDEALLVKATIVDIATMAPIDSDLSFFFKEGL